jgi:cation transport regulator ChaC
MNNKTKKNKTKKKVTKSNKMYVFGYGSLLNDKSRHKTLKRTSKCIPVILKKYAGFKQSFACNNNNCYLNIEKSKNNDKEINGILFYVNKDDITKLDNREKLYKRIRIPNKFFTSKDKNKNIPNGIIYTYTSTKTNVENKYITKSYLDIVNEGCDAHNISRPFN